MILLVCETWNHQTYGDKKKNVGYQGLAGENSGNDCFVGTVSAWDVEKALKIGDGDDCMIK